jgi:Subtilase family
MAEVFDSQYQTMHDAFARQGIMINVAYTPSGRADYLYQEGRLLTRVAPVTPDTPPVADEVLKLLPGAVLVRDEAHPRAESGLAVLDIEHLEGGYLSVPEALDLLDERLRIENPALKGGFPLVTAVHIMHLAGGPGAQPDTVRTCPATEPEVPCCCTPDEPCAPCPPPARDGGKGVLIGVCDTGLLADHGSAPWLNGNVTGALDPLGPQLSGGGYAIPKYCGHGTFIAGVARGQAPDASVYVGNEFSYGGGLREWEVEATLQDLLARNPQVVNLSAGTYSRNDWPLLSFLAFKSGAVPLTCAAGNDATDRKFWPAAFEWAIGVGALGADQRHRAWFSNYGDWVKVYTLGEGLVNAFATGTYRYHEPPKRPSVQEFHGRARWSGTSFAAPLVAGLIAAGMSGGVTAAAAAQALLGQAQADAVSGVGPVLYPRPP